MKVETSNNQMQTPKSVPQRVTTEDSRETQRMKAEEARKAETKQPRQTTGPDGAGLQINIQA